MKRQDKIIAALALTLMFLISFAPGILQAVDQLDWSGILPHIYTGSTGDEAINIAITQSTVGLDASEESALTNTVLDVIDLTHTTSGTPANSIGAGITYKQETSASNIESIMEVNAVVTDVTAGSEDAKFSVELMTAGAATAEKFSIGSTGVVTLVNAGTIDNSTNGTITITEPIVTVSGTLRADEWYVGDIAKTTAQSYSLASTGKASTFIQTVGEAATFHLMTELLTTPGAGAVITIKTGGTNDVVIDTEGAETIDGGADYTLNASYEAVTLTNDGSNWFVIGGYGE